MKLQVLLVSLVALALGQIPDEDWGYVDVRPGAHMFWWLYGSYQTPREKQPLILWLQGGPGGSSTGFGNFGELGPLDVNLQPRNTSWVYAANVLFIDNPVGTGYSYVDSADKYTTNNDQIAADLVSIFSAFLDAYPVFKTIPFYVFCESYGGKMTTGFANALLDAIHTGKVSSNFSGIALGDSWISPIDYVNTWGPLLYSMSLVDKHQLDRINVAAAATQQAVDNGQWNNATDLWSNVENVVEAVSANTDFYNILSRELPNQSLRRVKFAHPGESSIDSLRRIHLDPINQEDPLDKLMNTVIRQKLNGNPKKGKVIPDSVNWGAQAGNVFSALSGDFMRPVVTGDGSVDKLLQQNFPVTVYTGQLDLICCTLGTDLWMHRLTWGGMPNFFESPKIEHDMPNQPGVLGGFSKSYRNLRMWYIMMAGHMVPADNGPMALAMVRAITGGK